MRPRPQRRQTWERDVTGLLLAGELSPVAVDSVIEAGLAAYALDRLDDREVRNDPRLRSSRLVTTARHAATRSATVEVVRALREVGIETLLLKGFYLAEFVYPDPSWRTYSDVDVALRGDESLGPSDVAELAARVAQQHGYRVVWRLGEEASIHSFHDRDYNGHELLQLVHEATGTSIDAHRRLVHSNVTLRSQSGKGETLTSSVWDAATVGDLGGVPVFLPAPVDSALVGLIAARSWSGDRHALRPHDLLDIEVLMRHGGFGRAELLSRARELGLSATTRLFLRRCDPSAGTIDLRAPSPVRAFLYDALLVGERGHRGLAQASAAALAAPGKLMAVLRELPPAARQVARVRAGRRPVWRPFTGTASGRPLDRRTWRSAQLGVRRALRLLGVVPEDQRELALACLYDSVARRGFAVSLRTGAGRTWFEHEGQALPLVQLGVVDGTGGTERLIGWSVEADTSSPSRVPTWRRLLSIGWSGILLRLEAVLLLRRILAALNSHPFQEVRAKLLPGRSTAGDESRDPAEGGYGRSAAESVSLASAVPLGRAVESASRFVPGALCVAQALAGQVMLTRRGQRSTIHFGFLRAQSGAVEGHAWLEVEGAVVIGDGPLENFTRTATFDA